MNMRKRLVLLFVSLLISALTSAAVPAQQASSFDAIVNDYLTHYYLPNNPTAATRLGVHDYDGKMEDFSQQSINDRIAKLKAYANKVEHIPAATLSEYKRQNQQILLNHLRGQILNLEAIRYWQKNPDLYSGALSESAFVIVSRDYAPINKRLSSLIMREKAMPHVLQQARINLKNPPKVFTEIALEQLPGMITFFKQDVPAAFSKADPNMLKEFNKVNQRVVESLLDYQRWLQMELLAKSQGDFRLGTEIFEKKLSYDEMVDRPLAELLKLNEANMRQNQQEFKRIAQELVPGKPVEQVLAEINADYPSPDQLLTTFRGTFDHLINFIKTNAIITIPSDVQPIMEETPAFMRSITFASMDTPGPFEKVAKEAYFNVTLPQPEWDAAKQAQFMGQFSYPSISSIAIHETYPGHYVQFLWMQGLSDPLRQMIGAASNAEGWAHYAEQMMLDQGYAKGHDAKSVIEEKRLRLGQLLNALLRNARFTVAIKMHTGEMTFDQAVDYFVKEGYQPRAVGVIETKRGTMDPMYLYYTLGKLQILKLRADVMKRQGDQFNLKKFHDDFMRQGFPPIKIVRESMLHDQSPTL